MAASISLSAKLCEPMRIFPLPVLPPHSEEPPDGLLDEVLDEVALGELPAEAVFPPLLEEPHALTLRATAAAVETNMTEVRRRVIRSCLLCPATAAGALARVWRVGNPLDDSLCTLHTAAHTRGCHSLITILGPGPRAP